jgi:epoxide hydrolase-like predicted phosphatase
MSSIIAIIFDCFGVLYPAGSDIYFERHIEEFRGDKSILDDINTKIDLGIIGKEQFFQAIDQQIGVPSADIQEEFDEIKKVNQDVLELIKTLKKKYKVALLSNAGEGELDVLERDGITDLFEVTTVSYLLKIVKPDPKIYEKCAEDLGVLPHECLFIDDGPKNVSGAQDAGMNAILYQNFEQLKDDLEKLLIHGLVV